jgi:glycosyltransferase involved in cell wall biosynthesis
LIHVASLIGVKDQPTLLRALARLRDVTLDVIGEGTALPRLQTLARELNIAERVHFRGAVPHTELPAYYRQAALNVLTSRHEGLGMVTLEAALCGVPTVSTAVGLLPDCPAIGVTVPVGDDSALARAIDNLLNDPPRRAALSQSALRTVHERYTVQHTAGAFVKLYRELISRGQQREFKLSTVGVSWLFRRMSTEATK